MQEADPQLECRPQGMVREDFLLYCGACREAANAHIKGFDENDLGTKVFCYACKKLRRSKDWLCRCQICWYQCDVHRYAGRRAREEKQNMKDRPKSKEKTQKRRYEAVGKDEEKSISKRRRSGPQMISFTEKECRDSLKGDLKQSLLSGNLRQRFAHLCKESEA